MKEAYHRWVGKLLLAAVTTVVGLLFCEFVIRIVAPQDLLGMWFDPTERGSWVNRANWQDQHQRGALTVTYRINEYHLRGGPVEDVPVKVLCLGDSCTFGWLLPEQDTFVQRLNDAAQKSFPPHSVQFLNGGCGGWGAADYVAFAEEYGQCIHPKIVLIFLNTDDIQRALVSTLYGEEPAGNGLRPLPPPHRPATLKKQINSSKCYNWLLLHSHSLQLVRRIRRVALHKFGGVPQNGRATSHPSLIPGASVPNESPQLAEAGVRRARSLFLRLQDWCVHHDAQLIVLTTGYDAFAWPDFETADRVNPNAAFFAQADNFFRAAGIPYKDLGPNFARACSNRLDQVIIPSDGHPNDRGAALIATLTWSWLEPQVRDALNLAHTNTAEGSNKRPS